jgi:hypothetical protein
VGRGEPAQSICGMGDLTPLFVIYFVNATFPQGKALYPAYIKGIRIAINKTVAKLSKGPKRKQCSIYENPLKTISILNHPLVLLLSSQL